MKIKIAEKAYDEVMAIKPARHKPPKKQGRAFGWLLKTLSADDIKATNVTYNEHGMEAVKRGEPCLILMNHSSFIDLKIASDYLYPNPFSIICTSDGFVGKEWLMRSLGCIPAKKFVNEPILVRDISYALRTLKSSVLMYPEASYTFDGTATPLPESLGKLLKLLNVPVVTIITHGAFARDPLYNNLQLRKVDISVDVSCLLLPEQIQQLTVGEINDRLKQTFTFDNFQWQYENRVVIDEPFRADGLNRVLYKCPRCKTEGKMVGKGTKLRCEECGREYELTEYGRLRGIGSPAEFVHVPDWYAWEREEVCREILDGAYMQDIEVDICMLVDFKAVYRVGSGRLVHNSGGFKLTGCDGKLNYEQSPAASYGLYADYFWYEIGDMVCIGDRQRLYYCFPKGGQAIVAKTRLAAEEMYKLSREHKR